MNNRAVNLPEEEVANTIKYLSEEIEKIKTAQLSGGDVVTPKIISTSNDYDFNATFDGFKYYITLNIEFIANTQLNPYTTPVLKCMNTSGVELPSTEFQNYEIRYAQAQEPFTFHAYPSIDNYRDYSRAYIERITVAPFRVKLYLMASDEGQFNTIQS